ncbi:Serpentine Receptor, class BC (Class B-like) [Caenorhabditis elegans]|uniref:Serpentine Receptor, class BC (Class B-like) n=1 Tax=Caenorhabditis elegans TaxID=6239 RepID=P91076_CAEEL|nr:Serpentine Receptor, class BC (Class B-like) [Caenorhabditis elegans]CCD63002.2 Serpentine Receptor, class BC (Class B-like) [Caenorhabditis elegans]|eukprot:NP_001309476.1 Serpentine Receptor, class BC (class B-like) [Caenorhabditis elegans]
MSFTTKSLAIESGNLMNLSAVVITSIGILSSFFTIFMNIYFIKKITRIRHRMIFFFYRIFVDISYGVLACAYMIFCILYSYFTEELREKQGFIVYLGFPLQSVAAIRTIIAVAISIERVLALCTPVLFHNYRHRFPSIIILILAVCSGIFEDLVLFQSCTLNLSNIPRNCGVLRCAVDKCFFDHWADRSIMYALNFLCSGLLSIKLIFFNKSLNGQGEHSKVNHIALLDAANVFLCDFLPNSISNYAAQFEFSSFQNIGPYIYIIKLFGIAIETCFICWILKLKNTQYQPNTVLPLQK